jgi:hypothetical protein
VLILTPLCVAAQTIAEAARIGVEVGPLGGSARISITNYERLHQVRADDYVGIVLDESSILKAFDGATRTRVITMFEATPYRLCCTATPAPNDIAELANHCEFLGVMSRAEMLATFFVHDGARWRLKGHAHDTFYRWLASWGMFLRWPSDIGFADDGYRLPPLRIVAHIIETPHATRAYLFPGMGLGGIRGRLETRRSSLPDRVKATVQILEERSGQWIVWCGLNDEQNQIARMLGDDAVSVSGGDSPDAKTDRIAAFCAGHARVLVSKVRIAGFGLNLQQCSQMAFLGIGDSYEQYYQAIRRCWRFGQTRPVDVILIVSDAETEIVENVRRKEREATVVAAKMIDAMRDIEQAELGVTGRQRDPYVATQRLEVPPWLTSHA